MLQTTSPLQKAPRSSPGTLQHSAQHQHCHLHPTSSIFLPDTEIQLQQMGQAAQHTFPACSCFSPTLARAATIPTYSKPFPCPVNSKGRGPALGTDSPPRFRDRELPGGWKTTCEVILGAEIGLIWLNQTIREKRGRALKEHSSL